MPNASYFAIVVQKSQTSANFGISLFNLQVVSAAKIPVRRKPFANRIGPYYR
jgi:hypothetical protein